MDRQLPQQPYIPPMQNEPPMQPDDTEVNGDRMSRRSHSQMSNGSSQGNRHNVRDRTCYTSTSYKQTPNTDVVCPSVSTMHITVYRIDPSENV